MALGFIGGAALGGIGSAIDAGQTRKQQARFRRRQRQAIQSARDFTGGTSVSTGQGFFGDAGPAGGGATTFLDPTTGERRQGGRVEEILADPLLMQARSFLQGTFENAADSPLAQDFAKGIQAAQSARGTFFGGAAINTEAGGLAAFSQRLRQDLLPQALSFGTLGENLRQDVLGFEAGLRTSAATGGAGVGDSSNLLGPNVFGSLLSGAASGGAAGFSLDREFGVSSGLFSGAGDPSLVQQGAAPGTVAPSIQRLLNSARTDEERSQLLFQLFQQGGL